jgi:hypothetical protein
MTVVTVFCNMFTSASNQNVRNHTDVHCLLPVPTAVDSRMFIQWK